MEAFVLGVIVQWKNFKYSSFFLYCWCLKNCTGMQLHDLCVYWMNLVKVLLQKVSLCKRNKRSISWICYVCSNWNIADVMHCINVSVISDGIGLLGGTINHFVTCDDPPKVGSSSLTGHNNSMLIIILMRLGAWGQKHSLWFSIEAYVSYKARFPTASNYYFFFLPPFLSSELFRSFWLD